jgi:hypothetical protein
MGEKELEELEENKIKYDLSETALENAILEIQTRLSDSQVLRGLSDWEAAQVLQCEEYWEYQAKKEKADE